MRSSAIGTWIFNDFIRPPATTVTFNVKGEYKPHRDDATYKKVFSTDKPLTLYYPGSVPSRPDRNAILIWNANSSKVLSPYYTIGIQQYAQSSFVYQTTSSFETASTITSVSSASAGYIKITGGADADDVRLISWLESNCTFIETDKKIFYLAGGGKLVAGGVTYYDQYEYIGSVYPTVTASKTGFYFERWVDHHGRPIDVTPGTRIETNGEVISPLYSETPPTPPEPEYHTVTYNANGGVVRYSGNDYSTFSYTGEEFPTISVSRAYGTFLGWKDAGGNVVDVTPGNPITEDVYVIASWSITPPVYTYDITLNAGSGTVSPSVIYDVTEVPPLPVPVYQTGGFVGWYYEASFTTPVKVGDHLMSDITIYAKYTTDVITDPTTKSASGLFGMFVLTADQVDLDHLYQDIYSSSIQDLFSKDKMFKSEIDAICSIRRYPFSIVSKVARTGGDHGYTDEAVYINGIPITSISTDRPKLKYFTCVLDSEYIDVPVIYGNWLDYECQYLLYLPFVGYVSVPSEYAVGSRITPTYIVDFISGTATCVVKVNGIIRNTFPNISISDTLPITSTNRTEISGKLTSDSINGLFNTMGSTVSGAMRGGVGGAIGGFAGSSISAGINIGTDLYRLKNPSYSPQMLGSANTSMNLPMSCKMLIIKPDKVDSSNYEKLIGKPLEEVRTLGDLSGYVQIREVHTDGIIATKPELDEIESLLKSGVIL